MSERIPNIPQSRVDQIFKMITKNDTVRDLVPLEEHYHYLVRQGYSDDEIENIFDLKFTEEGEVHEV